MKRPTPPIEWVQDHIRIIDQTLLPTEVQFVEIGTAAQAVDAIQRLAIRGAPALGAFGSLALVVALDETAPATLSDAITHLEESPDPDRNARSTAVNLR